MKTAERLEEKWVVVVTDSRDVERAMPGYQKRFEFVDAMDAWECQDRAERAGFTATAEKVKRA